MPPKQLQIKRKRQLVEEARKGREARKKLRMSMMAPVKKQTVTAPSSSSSGAMDLGISMDEICPGVINSSSSAGLSFQPPVTQSPNVRMTMMSPGDKQPPSSNSMSSLGISMDEICPGVIPSSSSAALSFQPPVTTSGNTNMPSGSSDAMGLGISMDEICPGVVASSSSAALSFKSSISTPTTSGNTGKSDDILKTFAEQWKQTLDQEDLKSLGLFLLHIFTTKLEMTQARAADHTAKIIGKTDRTIRQWRSDLITYGEIRESRKGKHPRPKVLWANKDLTDKARAFVEANTAFIVHGKQSTMKIKDFRQWVNETLLPNQAVASLYSFVPGYGYAPNPTTSNDSQIPRKISLETARKWLREMGY